MNGSDFSSTNPITTAPAPSAPVLPHDVKLAEHPKPQGFVQRIDHWLERFQGVSLTEKAVFTQNLHIMIKSSIPLSQAMLTLSQQTRNRHFASMLRTMHDRIEKGETFSAVLGSYPKYFSEVFTSMIAAGESSGKLESILQELAKQLKKERILIGKVRGALIYPVIVTIAMVLIGIAMIIFVIPKISGIYAELGGKLPLPTRILIAVSDFVIHNGVLVTVGCIVLLFVFIRVLRTRAGRRAFDTVVLRLPIASTIVKKVSLARFARTLSSLLQTDIPIVQSFQIIKRTLGNVRYQDAMEDAAQALKKGIAVVEALRKHPALFPPLVTQMLSVGEQSGSLDELARDIADFYEEDVDETMSNFSAIIEPVLLLLLGLGVGGMAVAVLLPIYTLTEQV